MNENQETFQDFEPTVKPTEPAEDISVSKVDLVRELIVGPDKKEIEAQITGMRDLFTSMLVENKKEYDRQVGEMKNLFVNILEENRKTFADQLVQIQTTLPRMVEKSVKSAQSEGLIMVANEQRAQERVEKLTRINAVEQIIIGDFSEKYTAETNQLGQQLQQHAEAQQQALQDAVNEVNQALKASVDRMNKQLQSTFAHIQQQLQQNQEERAPKQLISVYLKEVAKKVSE